MKLSLLTGICASVCASAFAADPSAAPGGSTNLVDKGSYALGANLGNNLRAQGAEPKLDLVIQGLRDGMSGKVAIPEQELRESLIAWQRELRNVKLEKNKSVGTEFMAKKAQDASIKKFPDGMMYKVLATGKAPT